jgi:hypothetical protein
MSKPRIIVLAGDIGHGKSTVAKHLESVYGLMRHRFAGPIKALVSELFVQAGDDRDHAENICEDSIYKNIAIRELYGRSPRDFMRALGDVGRGIDAEFWANIIMTRIHTEYRADRSLMFVIDDWRYPVGEGGRLLAGDVLPFFVRVNRPSKERSLRNHSSEGGLDDWNYDWILWNEENQLTSLYAQIEAMLEHFKMITADEGR